MKSPLVHFSSPARKAFSFAGGTLIPLAAWGVWVYSQSDSPLGESSLPEKPPQSQSSENTRRSPNDSSLGSRTLLDLFALSQKEILQRIDEYKLGESSSVLETLLTRLAETDPQEALRRLSLCPIPEEEPVVGMGGPEGITVKDPKGEIRSRILMAWLGKDPAAAKSWMLKNLSLAQLRPDVLKTLAMNSFSGALNLIKSFKGNPVELRNAYAGLASAAAQTPMEGISAQIAELSQDSPDFFRQFVSECLIRNPLAVEKLLETIPESSLRGTSAGDSIVHALGESNPAKAVELGLRWMGNTLAEEANQDVLRRLVSGDGVKKLVDFQGLDGEYRLLRLASDYQTWRKNDPAAATAFAATVSDPLLKEALAAYSLRAEASIGDKAR
jgi:hypothetical protein